MRQRIRPRISTNNFTRVVQGWAVSGRRFSYRPSRWLFNGYPGINVYAGERRIGRIIAIRGKLAYVPRERDGMFERSKR